MRSVPANEWPRLWDEAHIRRRGPKQKRIKEGTTLECSRNWTCMHYPYYPCPPACPVLVVPR